MQQTTRFSPPRPPRRLAAFTLVELLVTISIIALLAGLVTYGVTAMKGTSEISRTKTLLQGLKAVDIEYRAQSGYIVPFDGTADTAEESIEAFCDDVVAFDDPQEMLVSLGEDYLRDTDSDAIPNQVIDAWGEPVQYRAYMQEQAPAFTGAGDLPARGTQLEPQPYFASAGPDGVFGTNDDIYSFNLD
jgi:prepilin-type N-terminal cleavage/methylation domain-containing protein